MNTEKTQKKIKVVCMGDSITEGFGLGTNKSVYYPSILQKYLGEDYQVFKQGSKWQLCNKHRI